MVKKVLCGLMIWGCMSENATGMRGASEEMSVGSIKRKVVPLMVWHEDELLPVPIAQRVVHDNAEGMDYFKQIEALPQDLIESVTNWYQCMLGNIVHGDQVPDFCDDDEFYTTVGFLKACIDKMSSSESESD